MWNPNRRHLLASATALVGARQIFAQSLKTVGARTGAAPTSASYDLAEGLTYLNHASIGTVPRIVREAHARYLEVCESNPWLYMWGGAWEEAFDRVHELSAAVLGAAVDQVAVVRNTTAAFGMAANGLPLGDGHEVLFSSLNHTGASASWDHASEARGFRVRRFDFPEKDVASLTAEDVTAAHVEQIRETTEVLVLPHIDNVFGIRHDVAAIASAARKRGVRWVLVDAAQSVGMIPVNVAELGVDMFATSAHKWLQAPKGTGLMALSAEALRVMRPLVTSWGQRRTQGTARMFTDFGTRDLAKVLTIADAIQLHGKQVEGRVDHHRALHALLQERVAATKGLTWRSPKRFDDGGALVAIGLESGSPKAVAAELFEAHGVVVRGFEGGVRRHLRVSPNTLNDERDIEVFFEAIG